MEIDLYQPCPCHSEKKIKFCCGKNVAAGLRDVLSLHESRQTAAALDQLERLIAGEGPRDCLLLARSQLELKLDRPEDAERTIRQFLANNPGHAAGLERLATAVALQRREREAWEALQDAMDHLPGSEIPVSFAEGFRTVALALLFKGQAIAARSHVEMACFLENLDPFKDQLWVAVQQMTRSSLIVQRSTELEQLPDGFPETPWKKRYTNAVRAANRRQFRKAGELLGRALEATPGEPRLLVAAAMVALQGPDADAAVAALRRVAECTAISMPERIEAEMLAREISPSSEPMVDQVTLTWELTDFDSARDRIAASDRFLEMGFNPEEWDENAPPPRLSGVICDRPQLKSVDAGTTWQDVPVVQAQLAVFGRETDRPPRLEMELARDQHFGALQSWLRELLKDLVAGESEEVDAEIPASRSAMSVQWSLPPSTPREHWDRLVRERLFHAAREIIPGLSFRDRNGAPLREVARDPARLVDVQATVCQLELSNDAREWIDSWGQTLRETLGIPSVPEVGVDELQAGSLYVPWLARYLRLESIPTPLLRQLGVRAEAARDFRGLRRLFGELLRREDRGGTPAETGAVDMQVHLVLAQISADDTESMQHLAGARAAARKAGASTGMVLVTEFEQCFVRGKLERLPEILREVQLHHANEAGVREALARALIEFGLVTRDGQIALPVAAPTEAAAPSLWTPDSGAPAAAKTSSGLWLPGQ